MINEFNDTLLITPTKYSEILWFVYNLVTSYKAAHTVATLLALTKIQGYNKVNLILKENSIQRKSDNNSKLWDLK